MIRETMETCAMSSYPGDEHFDYEISQVARDYGITLERSLNREDKKEETRG